MTTDLAVTCVVLPVLYKTLSYLWRLDMARRLRRLNDKKEGAR